MGKQKVSLKYIIHKENDERSIWRIFENKSLNIFLSIALFYILDIANAISRKVLVLEARNIYHLIEYNENIIW